jgi:rare lipoprotein A
MRPPFNVRAGQAVPALGALITTTFVSSGPLAAHAASGDVAASPASAEAQALEAALLNAHVGYRKPLVVTGRLVSGQPGQPLTLEYQPSGATSWQTVATATTGPAGGYRMTARLDRSGVVRVAGAAAATLRTAVAPSLAANATTTAGDARPVYVGAAIASRTAQRNVLNGQRVTVRGSLRPLAQDAPVVLQAHRAHRWVTLARAHTGRSGRYTLRFTPRQTGSVLVRVRFGGSAVNDASAHRVGVINVYRVAGASWYDLLGSALACGGSLTSGTLGVANKTLPCGTMVTLHYGSRTVRVPVVDRGPYVAGRDYDLTPATKARLGFGDTGTLWATA